MKVLFATTNPAKVKKYRTVLKINGIEVLTISDLEEKVEVEETEKDVLKNAYIKAKAYHDLTGMTTIGMDNTLFIEGLPEEEQPGTHPRRVNGRVLDDDEMIKYYSNLAIKHWGKLTARWQYGMVIYDKNYVRQYAWTTKDFFLVGNPSDIRIPGYPLYSISIDPDSNKYFVEMTAEDKKQRTRKDVNDKSVQFILNNINKKQAQEEEYEI